MNFKELLSIDRTKAIPDGEQLFKRIMKKRTLSARLWIAGSIMASALIVGAVVFLISVAPNPKKEVVLSDSVNIIQSVEARKKSSLGIERDTDFVITTTEEITSEELRERLVVKPQTDFQLKKIGECRYSLSFDTTLPENTLYNISAVYENATVYRWAFQTENRFAVTGAYPANEKHVSPESAIEVTFSHQEVNGFETAFKIEPAVEGSFEHYGRTWAFIPSKPMAPATLYTVTISADVMGPDGVKLEEPYVFSFFTEATNHYAYLIHRRNEIADTFLVDESPVAAVAYDGFEAKKASVKVYMYQNSEEFVDAYRNYVRSGVISGEIIKTAETEAFSFETTPILAENYDDHGKTAFIHYPEPAVKGYYFAEISLEERKVYQLFQSTDLAIYTISANGEYTVWVNNAISGEPVVNAQTYLDAKKKNKTNEYGFASFTAPAQENEIRFLSVENGEYPYVVPVNGNSPDEAIKMQEKYLAYITTNSSLYKTTDKIGVFGIVLPRGKKGGIPDEVTLRCDFADEITLKPDANGVFSAELKVENTSISGDLISLYIGDVLLDSVWINIADYDLPSYVVSVSTDRSAYTAGEIIKASVAVTYPDGTPASGVPVEGDINGVTDQNGWIGAELIASGDNFSEAYSHNCPQIDSVTCNVAEGLGYSVTASAEYAVFNGDYYLHADFKDDSLNITANYFDKVNLERCSGDELFSKIYREEAYTGLPADVSVSAEVHRVVYHKEIKDTTYDPINKKVEYNWNYTETDEHYETFNLNLSGGKTEWKFDKSFDENERYYVVLRVIGEATESAVRCELYDDAHLFDRNNYGVYSVKADDQEKIIGDTVDLQVCDSKDGSFIGSGSVFYTVVGSEMLDHYYGSTTEMKFKFKKEYAPGVSVYGAYFDGEHIYDLGAEDLYCNLENAQLNIEFETDNDRYAPGDEVSATVKVTDWEGKPVSAVLYMSVLDRSLFLLNNNADDPLYDLYNRFGYSDVFVTTSYRHFGDDYIPGGEGGGGGGASRGNFEDTPYAEVIKTNRKGEAEITFKLPDTITEWKAVIKAFTNDAQGCCSVFDIVSTQDYFVSVSMGENIKTTDECTLAVKSDGTGLKPEAVCKYQVGLTDRDGKEVETLTAEAKKGQYVYLNFGHLDKGVYTVYVNGTDGTWEDNVILPVTVTDQQNSMRINQNFELSANSTVNVTPSYGNVLLAVTDKEYAFRQKVMQRLNSNGGRRVDQVLGAYLAENFFVTGKWMEKEQLDLNLLQPYYSGNGLKLFPDSEYEDLKVAAKFAAAMSENCRKDELISQFSYYLNDRLASKTDVIVAYFGMAALGEPVLADLQSFYHTVNEFSVEQTVYLAMAFAYAGDYDTAKYLYEQKIKSLVKIEGEIAYVECDGMLDEELTGSVSMLANRLSLDVAEKLITYILEHDSEVALLNFDLITYLNDYVLDLSGKNVFMLKTASGESKTYTFAKTSLLTVELSSKEAESLTFNPIEGNSVAVISYIGNYRALSEIEDGGVISGIEHESEVNCGAVMTIVVPVRLPSGYKGGVLYMTLPAGLRLAEGRVHYGTYGNEISAGYDRDKITVPLSGEVKNVILTLRGGLPGNYVIEPIVIMDEMGQHYISSDPLQISVIE